MTCRTGCQKPVNVPETTALQRCSQALVQLCLHACSKRGSRGAVCRRAQWPGEAGCAPAQWSKISNTSRMDTKSAMYLAVSPRLILTTPCAGGRRWCERRVYRVCLIAQCIS